MSTMQLRRSSRRVSSQPQVDTPKTRSKRISAKQALFNSDDQPHIPQCTDDQHSLDHNSKVKTPSSRRGRKSKPVPTSPSLLMANLSLVSPQKCKTKSKYAEIDEESPNSNDDASDKSFNFLSPAILSTRTGPVVTIYDSDEEDQIIDLTADEASEPDDSFSFPIKEKSVPTKNCLKKTEIASPTKQTQARTPRKSKSNTEIQMGSPPKLQKMAENNENKIPLTPSTLFENLAIKSPKNRKQLFIDESDVYKNARQALHSSCPTEMPARQQELDKLQEFIVDHLENGSSGTLYVSGPPGTGKTASLNLILQQDEIAARIKQIYVNCTTIKSSSAIFSRIAKDLGVKSFGKSEKDYIHAIENYLNRNHRTILLVLDEIDQLESKNQSVLYTIFEWPANPKSKLILIGIANALDLTDRILPRLQARCELKPKLMHFAPYTKQQIIEIFTARLKSAGVLSIFSPVAIQMLAGKVAAISGDVRRALDIGRRVIEMVDRNQKDCDGQLLKSIENVAKMHQQQTVELNQVVNVLNNVYGACQNFNDNVDDDTFPLQQKIVICSLLLMLKKAKNKDVTIGRLHDVYRKVCNKRNIQVVDQSEFVGLCALIETRGILRVIRKKDPRMSKISLMWDEDEVGNAMKDKQLMSTILQDESCLGKI